MSKELNDLINDKINENVFLKISSRIHNLKILSKIYLNTI